MAANVGPERINAEQICPLHSGLFIRHLGSRCRRRDHLFTWTETEALVVRQSTGGRGGEKAPELTPPPLLPHHSSTQTEEKNKLLLRRLGKHSAHAVAYICGPD